MITYAAYSGAGVNLKEIAVVSVLADTAISFLAGLAVFPIVFAYGLDPASGPGLVFITLPLAFAQMPFGTLAAFGFFVLLFVAALASAISMLELVVALLMRRFGLRRVPATRDRGQHLLLGRDRHGSFVQRLGGLASARAPGGVRERHRVRPAGLPDLQHPAAARRPGHCPVRGLGDPGSHADRRARA